MKYHDIYSSSSDHEEEKENKSVEENTGSFYMQIRDNDFILIRFPGKKTDKFYAGVVKNTLPEDDGYEVKYLGKSKGAYFVFPDVDDIGFVDKGDIEKKLSLEKIDKRGHHYFGSTIFSKYKIL